VTGASSSPSRAGRGRPRLVGTALVAGALGLGGAGLLALAPVSPASAHDYVVSSTPAEGSTQSTELAEASITFNDVILDLSGTGSSNVLEVTDAAGLHFEDGCSTTNGATLSTGVALGAAGDYTMTYQAVSADGHTVSASLPFTWAPPEGAAVAEGADARPVCDAADTGTGAEAGGSTSATPEPDAGSATGADESASAEPSAAATADDLTGQGDADEANLGLVVGIGAGIVVLALVAVVVVLVTSRRRGDDLAGPAGSGDDDTAAGSRDEASGDAGPRDGRD